MWKAERRNFINFGCFIERCCREVERDEAVACIL